MEFDLLTKNWIRKFFATPGGDTFSFEKFFNGGVIFNGRVIFDGGGSGGGGGGGGLTFNI